jgi:hypothetical protein
MCNASHVPSSCPYFSLVEASFHSTPLGRYNREFKWSDIAETALNKLKELFTTVPILTIYDWRRHIILETDALDYTIRACISQPNDVGLLRPIAFYSRKMTAPKKNYNIHNKELLAVVEAFREWRVYLKGLAHTVEVYMDHKNLIYFTTTKQLNHRQTQ